MIYLTAENISKSYGERTLFRGLELSLAEGQKVALVARNGEGKSTLMKILAGRDQSDNAGQVRVAKDIRMAYLPQEPELNPAHTVLESVLAEGNSLVEAIKAYEVALEKQAEDDNNQTRAQLQAATDSMENLKAWDYELKIRQILSRLKITRLGQQVSELSGGQRKRIALAKVLIEEPDLVLMDEPTNHLDLDMIEWLEEYLSRGRTALLLVTHDRYFLDRVTTEILELEDGKLYRYKGNYEYYLEKKAEAEESGAKETEKSRNLLRKELEWMRRQPKARGTKAKYRIDAYYELEEKAKGKQAREGLQLEVKMQRLGGKILELHHVNKRFGDLKILDDFNYIFQKKERIGIVGPNGVGKTTFLEMLTGKASPDSGDITTGETVAFGYYTQAGLKIPEDKRVIEVVTEIAEVIPLGNGKTVSASQFLQRFGFEPQRQYTFVSKLSGGERRRLHLLTILVKNPNFLILDEPTNDLDIITLNTLEEFLQGFPGCLIIVTHDRYFMDKLVDHLFIFEGEGKIRDFNGRYAEYRDWLDEEERAKKAAQKPLAPPVPFSQPKTEIKKKASYKEQREYEQLEAEIPALEQKISDLEAKMSAGEGTHSDFQAWGQEMEKLRQELDDKTNRWLELGEMM